MHIVDKTKSTTADMCDDTIDDGALSITSRTMCLHIEDSSGDVSSNHINLYKLLQLSTETKLLS
jgi:hypothetical protein